MRDDYLNRSGDAGATTTLPVNDLPRLRRENALLNNPSAGTVRALLKDPEERRVAASALKAADGETAAIYLRAICQDAADLTLRSKLTMFVSIDIDRAIDTNALASVGLILNELIINALQHAHPTRISGIIDVWCRIEANELRIDVNDDGVALPDDFDAKTDGAFGFALMRELAAELGATLVFESTMIGLGCRLRVPLS